MFTKFLSLYCNLSIVLGKRRKTMFLLRLYFLQGHSLVLESKQQQKQNPVSQYAS